MNAGRQVGAVDQVSVLVVAGQEILRHALTDLIAQQSDMAVCAHVHDLEAARCWHRHSKAEVAIIDWPSAYSSERRLVKALSTERPVLRLIAVSLYDDPVTVKEVFDLGFAGYVTKAMAAEALCTAIRDVAAGKRVASSDVAGALPSGFLEGIYLRR